MRPDSDDFATLIVAQQFQLVDGTGNDVADFGPATINGVAGDALIFHHNTVIDSYLGWTRAPLGFDNYVELHGPTNSETHLLMSGTGLAHGVTELYGGDSTVFLQDTAVDIQTNDTTGSIGLVAGTATGNVTASAGGTIALAGGSVAIGANTGNISLSTANSVTLGGRTARMMVDSFLGGGGDTGNVAGATTVILVSKVLALKTGDIVVGDGTSWVQQVAASLFSGTGWYINGAQNGQLSEVVSNNAFDTYPLPPLIYGPMVAAGNITFQLRLVVQAGGTLRSIESTMRLLVFGTQ